MSNENSMGMNDMAPLPILSARREFGRVASYFSGAGIAAAGIAVGGIGAIATLMSASVATDVGIMFARAANLPMMSGFSTGVGLGAVAGAATVYGTFKGMQVGLRAITKRVKLRKFWAVAGGVTTAIAMLTMTSATTLPASNGDGTKYTAPDPDQLEDEEEQREQQDNPPPSRGSLISMPKRFNI